MEKINATTEVHELHFGTEVHWSISLCRSSLEVVLGKAVSVCVWWGSGLAHIVELNVSTRILKPEIIYILSSW